MPQFNTVLELFLRLAPLFVFIDYHLLEYFISTFGSAALRMNMTLYKRDIVTFMRETTVDDILKAQAWRGKKLTSPDFKELWVKISCDAKRYTLEGLNELRNKHY